MRSGTAVDERPEEPIGWVGIYLRGVAMGIADAVPGVSGGTIALITGIYDRLIVSVARLGAVGPRVFGAVRRGGPDGRIEEIRRILDSNDSPFLIVLGIGVLTGVLILANVIEIALDRYRAVTFAFFLGVILASPLVLRAEVSIHRRRPAFAGLTGIVFAFWFSGLPYRSGEFGLPALFLIGAIAISAMVLPGISGSLVLLILGAYGTMISAVGTLSRGAAAVIGGGSVEILIAPVITLGVFSAGALVGVLTFARVVSAALGMYRATTMTFMVGLMVGALRTPAREILASVDRFTPGVIAGLVAAGAFGVMIVVLLEFTSDGLEAG